MFRKVILGLAIVGLALVGMASTTVFAKKPITVKGSDTMVILGQRWAEEFMKANPDVVVQVTGGGSGVGIAALINGATDIAEASRSMKQSEKEKLRDRFNTLGVEISMAKDGITIYADDNNPVTELSLDQLKKIYTGEVTNWKDVGGKDAKIVLYGRENSSGTYAFFKENVLMNADYAPQTQTLPGTAAVVNAVSKDENGIGYGGAAYAKGVKVINVKKDPQSVAIAPSLETVTNGTYPISRDLYWYTRNKPSGDIKKFVDFALSVEGQKIVSEVGYFPLKAAEKK